MSGSWTVRIPFTEEVADLIAVRFAALADPVRLRILDALRFQERASVGAVAETIGARHGNVSKHLRVLYAAKIVARRKQATSVIYWISDPVVLQVCDLICGALRDDLYRLGALLDPPPLPASTEENHDLSPDHPRRPRLRVLSHRRRERRGGGCGRSEV